MILIFIGKLRHFLSIVNLDELLLVCSIINLPLVDLRLVVVVLVILIIDASMVLSKLIDKFNFVLVYLI